MPVQRSYEIHLLDHVPPALLEGMLTFIKESIPVVKDEAHLLSRSKFILTELVTNAIKHANTMVSTVTVRLDANSISFVKTDTGDKLDVPQMSSESVPHGKVITTDIMHTLYSVNENDRITFYCHEHPEPSLDDEHTYPEHFGLLIITKASDDFYYRYDQSSQTNIFTVTINF
ncbi:ATP-binding protein [Mucilaginibacter ginkgonis]|uniref:ATP-binding protein n=1 Tax=Mucilaginibacter ginkgonis TaxID=2682091 RepID=A0A6I4I6R5_9SPHI|nr:ATP-binding protein [Mucilaginibacter ginkgonis]QQL50887.1 ATP-binding protein [Mucilaginibacter ginkgonis]